MKTIDHRTRVTKILIKTAFINLLKDKPISTISVKELCVAAGINRGTFYNNYNDLNDLLEQLESAMLEEIAATLEPMLVEDASPFAITTSIFTLVKDNVELFYVTLGPNGDSSFFQTILNLGKQHCIDSYAAKYHDIPLHKLEIHYTFVSAGCVALLRRWLNGEIEMTVDEIGKAVDEIISTGSAYLQQNGG